jgi:EAL domain-containing protein (putative c-di-GMP-specific phosphodiesterase class I)
LELTETALLEANQRVLDFMAKLDSVGVKFALDDFGTGYSSLTHLRTFPLSTVKVDQSFVRHLPNNHGDEAIVSAVVSLAANLGMQVVAEGVETEDHAKTLERLGCRNAQGYYLGIPISAEDITRRLRQQAQSKVALH